MLISLHNCTCYFTYMYSLYIVMMVIVVKVKDSINLAALTHIPYLLPSAFSLPNILAVFFTSFAFAIFYNMHSTSGRSIE